MFRLWSIVQITIRRLVLTLMTIIAVGTGVVWIWFATSEYKKYETQIGQEGIRLQFPRTFGMGWRIGREECLWTPNQVFVRFAQNEGCTAGYYAPLRDRAPWISSQWKRIGFDVSFGRLPPGTFFPTCGLGDGNEIEAMRSSPYTKKGEEACNAITSIGFAQITTPLWFVIVGAGIYPLTAFFRGPARRWVRLRRKACVRCGYSLIGNISRTCPECGRPTGTSST